MDPQTTTAPSIHPTTNATASSGGGADSIKVLETIKEEALRIILRRRQNSIVSAIAGPFVVIGLHIFMDAMPIVGLVAILVVFSGFAAIHFLVNSANYPEPKRWYRKWNKYVYTIGSKLLIVFAVLNIISNIRDLLNPFYGFKDPTARTRTALAVHTLGSGVLAVRAHNELKPAERVEAYYAQLDLIAYQQEQEQEQQLGITS